MRPGALELVDEVIRLPFLSNRLFRPGYYANFCHQRQQVAIADRLDNCSLCLTTCYPVRTPNATARSSRSVVIAFEEVVGAQCCVTDFIEKPGGKLIPEQKWPRQQVALHLVSCRFSLSRTCANTQSPRQEVLRLRRCGAHFRLPERSQPRPSI